MTNETTAKRAIRRRLEIAFPGLLVRSAPQTGFGAAGACDQNGVWYDPEINAGRYVGIEVKTPKAITGWHKGLSMAQVDWGILVLECRGLWMVVSSADEAEAAMRAAPTEAYWEDTLSMLYGIRAELELRRSPKWEKHQRDWKRKREVAIPKTVERIMTELDQAEANRQINERFKRRMKKAKIVPFEVLVHGLSSSRKPEET